MMSLLVHEVDWGSLTFLSGVKDLVVSFETLLDILPQPQPHKADCVSINSIGAANKKRGMLDIVQYFRNPTFLIPLSLENT